MTVSTFEYALRPANAGSGRGELAEPPSLHIACHPELAEGCDETCRSSCYLLFIHIRSVLRRLLYKDDRLSWSEHLVLIRALSRWERQIEQFPILPSTNGDVVAYVANFNRPQNIAPIVRSLLACPSINRIIVSNNNPACDLDRWFSPMSDRITVLSHATPQRCVVRHLHLKQFPSPFYVMIDDDIFLLPSQIEQLLTELRNDPSVPHGIFGQVWEGEHFRQGVMRTNEDVDVINRVYAFTAAQHAETLKRIASMQPTDSSEARTFGWCDDVLLSVHGSSKPRIHDIGPMVDCPTQGKKGIAVWREDDFFASREALYKRLRSITAP